MWSYMTMCYQRERELIIILLYGRKGLKDLKLDLDDLNNLEKSKDETLVFTQY